MDTSRFGFNADWLEKRKRLIESDLNPYPYRYTGTIAIKRAKEEGDGLQSGEVLTENTVVVVGRIVGDRFVFKDLKDQSGNIQIYFQKKNFKDLWGRIDNLDIGDIIGVAGPVGKTHRDEITIMVEEFTILSKAAVPIPFGK